MPKNLSAIPMKEQRATLAVVCTACLLCTAEPLHARILTWASGEYLAAGLPQALPAGDVVNAITGPLPGKVFGSNVWIDGRLNWQTSDGLGIASGATLGIRGLFDVQADSSISGGGSIDSFGTIRKSAGGGTWAFNVPLRNRAGAVLAADSGILQYRVGSTFEAGSRFEGAGRHLFASGAPQTFNFLGNFSASASATIEVGGFANFSSAVALVRPDANLLWTGGGFSGNWAIGAGRSLTAQGSGSKNLAGSMEVAGDAHWASSANLTLASGGALRITGLFDLQTDAGIAGSSGTGGVENLGILRKSGGGGSSAINVALVNRAGAVLDAVNGTLQYRVGSIFESDITFQGGGRHLFDSGAQQTYSFAGDFGVAAGTVLQVGGFANFASSGSGTVRPFGDMLWTSGSFSGAWGVRRGYTLTAAAGSGKTLNGVLENAGTLNWTSADTLNLSGGARLINLGLVDLKSDGTAQGVSGAAQVENSGTLRKSLGEGIWQFNAPLLNRTGGILDAASGTMQYRSGGAFELGTLFTGGGRHLFASGAPQRYAFSGDFAATPQTTVELSSFATFANSSASPVRPLANLLWTGGAGRLEGAWTVRDGFVLTVNPGGSKTIDGHLVNEGTVLWATSDGVNLLAGSTLRNEGRFEVLADGAATSTTADILNAGLWRKSVGGGEFRFRGELVNTGIIESSSGTIRLPDNWRNDGTLRGAASLQTNRLTNQGTIAPGRDGEEMATLTLVGLLTQGSAGRLSFQLGVQTEPTSTASSLGTLASDRLVVSGGVTLGGTLVLEHFGTYQPSEGDAFLVMNYASASGSFSGIEWLGFGPGVAFGTRLVPNGLEVVVTAVPEPTSLLLLALGVAIVLMQRRRPVTR